MLVDVFDPPEFRLHGLKLSLRLEILFKLPEQFVDIGVFLRPAQADFAGRFENPIDLAEAIADGFATAQGVEYVIGDDAIEKLVYRDFDPSSSSC